MALLPLLQSTAGQISRTNFTEVVINEHWNADGWGPVAAYSLLISVFVVALAYIIAEFLRSPQLNAWAKAELYEFIVSALIIANLFFGLTVMNTLVFEITGGLDHFGVANDYLDQLVRAPSISNMPGIRDILGGSQNHEVGDITSAYLGLWGIELVSGLADGFQLNFLLSSGPELAFLRVGFIPFAGLKTLTPAVMSLLDMMGIILLAFIAQKALLVLFKETMFTLFLPLGITLRAFPISRRLGSTLIAIAITCYVIYPLTLAMNLSIYDSIPKNDAMNSNLLSIDLMFQELGRSKEGHDCLTPAQCNGAPCVAGVCGNKFGQSCRIREDCEGAPCYCNGDPSCDCSLGLCTCHPCPPIGTDCTDEKGSECCGGCQKVSETAPPTCQVFAVDPLTALTYSSSNLANDDCPTPDPESCADDFDCPCSGMCNFDYPDLPPGQGRCGVPYLEHTDLTKIFDENSAEELNCPSYNPVCLINRIYNAMFNLHGDLGDIFNEKLITYFFVPFLIPELVFDLLATQLPKLLWAPVVAAGLGIVDIIICITFFRSISESIGGEPTIWGLSRAM